jgi:DNA modification methylase
MAQIVKLVSQPGDLVLDPWMGSGTTGLAALALRRKFIGIDAVPKYVGLARQKLRAVQTRMM